MNYLEIARGAIHPDDENGDSYPQNVSRCPTCQRLDEQGVKTLICSVCGYRATLKAPGPTALDLQYSRARVEETLPTLDPASKEFYDYWMDVYLRAGWPQEAAQRGALRRALRASARLSRNIPTGRKPK